jgi:hypothetical protein
MASDDLTKLAERVEALIGPCRETDKAIMSAVSGWNPKGDERPTWKGFTGIPLFTSSIDHASALAPKDAFWRVGHDGEGPDPSLFRADVMPWLGAVAIARGETPALALAAAALRAIAEAKEVVADCPTCSGDCGSANPPMIHCPMRDARALAEAQKDRS